MGTEIAEECDEVPSGERLLRRQLRYLDGRRLDDEEWCPGVAIA